MTGDWPEWMGDPNRPCRGKTSTFVTFARETRHARETRVRLARQLCAVCPHLMACRTWGREHPEEYGIYGGLTDAERRPIRHGTMTSYNRHGCRCPDCETAMRRYETTRKETAA